MKDKILRQFIDFSRADLRPEEAGLIALTLIAWNKISQRPECPEALKMSNCRHIHPEEFQTIMRRLSDITGDAAFDVEEIRLLRTSQLKISDAIEWCLGMAASGLLTQYDPTDAILTFGERELAFPEEVCDLIVGLAGDIANQEVYLPWESSGQLTGRVIKKKARGLVETKMHTRLPALVASILADSRQVHVAHTDLLRQPHYIEHGRLKTFGTTVALLPFNAQVPPEIAEHDLFNRFREKTRSMTVLTVRHILAQTKGRAIFTTTNSLLFGAGAEQNLRKDLLIAQQIEAVVALPAGLLGMTAIPFTMVVLNTTRSCKTVRFINADTPRFKEAVSRTRMRLTNIDELVDIVLSGKDSDVVRNVSTQEILENEAQLQVNRYVLGEKDQQVARLLISMELRRLDQVATMVKPLPFKPSSSADNDSGIKVYEVGASDLPDYGYIRRASREILVDQKIDKIREQFLRPHDIVLIVKGNLGKVGIVPQNVPPPGPGGWVAGQSAVVLRIDKANQMDARALFILLRSGLGTKLIKTLASGAAISFVQLRELKQLAIPIPTQEKCQEAVSAFIEEEEMQRKILEIQQLQKALAQRFWALDDIAED